MSIWSRDFRSVLRVLLKAHGAKLENVRFDHISRSEGGVLHDLEVDELPYGVTLSKENMFCDCRELKPLSVFVNVHTGLHFAHVSVVMDLCSKFGAGLQTLNILVDDLEVEDIRKLHELCPTADIDVTHFGRL